MSTTTRITITRAGTTVLSSVDNVTIENMSQQEASYYGGAAPYERFTIFLEYAGWVASNPYLLEIGDLITDTQFTDLLTGKQTRYRIIARPESFPDMHVEIVADKVRGT